MRRLPTNIRKGLGVRVRAARSPDRAGNAPDTREAAQTPDPTHAPGEPGGPTAPARVVPPVPPVVVPRWIQLVLLPLAILGLWELARAAGSVLVIVVFAGVVALILNTPVKALERRGIPRPLGIPTVYLSGVAALAVVGIILSNPIATQISHFQRNLPSITRQANNDLGNLQSFLNRHGINVHIQKQGQTALQTIEHSITKQSGAIVSFSSGLLAKVATISFGLVLALVLSVYLLIYSASIGDLVRRVMPPGDGTPEDDYPYRVQRAVLGYVRGQLLFSVLMGSSAAIALWIFGVTGVFPDGGHYALFFGGFYGLMELVPYVGPILGALPPVLVALLVHPITAVWVTLLFVVLQQMEGHIVAPQVFRISLRINPILVILALLIGDQLYGIAGALLALPVSAVLRETVVYLRRHLVLEPWTAAGGDGSGAIGVRLGARDIARDVGRQANSQGPEGPRCPDCGAAGGPGDAFCRACGTSLEPRVRTPG